MYARIAHSFHEVSADDWNALALHGNPFLRHEFFTALEDSGATQRATGWEPQPLLLWDDGDAARLVGAVPLFRKHHSYGEYVFDWAWADAYARAGLAYYPKLVAGVPFTPVGGARLLIHPEAPQEDVATHLIRAALDHANSSGVSSLHWLFTSATDTERLAAHDQLIRNGYQFHWENAGYRQFDDFLAGLSAQKRKKIKRERRFVREAGVQMDIVCGPEIDRDLWGLFFDFYQRTIRKHGALPYLSREFFFLLGERLPQAVVLILARHGGRVVAAALNLRGHDTLYGRYWGGEEGYHSLHFETCYYRAIEYCIEQGLKRCEAGAQGEHKLARGFLPTPTHSAHWLRHPQFSAAVADFLDRERAGVGAYVHELHEHSPFKQGS